MGVEAANGEVMPDRVSVSEMLTVTDGRIHAMTDWIVEFRCGGVNRCGAAACRRLARRRSAQ
jgi:hypothetical protein